MKLQDLLIQAKACSHHVAQPVYRHACAKYGKTYEVLMGDNNEPRDRIVRALCRLMQAVDGLDDPQAILKTGEAISTTVDAIRANMPKPERAPRWWWMEGDRA